ncbi:MAG: cytochrome c biogenesis heme-transporting ATPase CcmA [Porticoccaceae bacterium]
MLLLSASPILECRDITFERDYMPVFAGLSFALQPGEVLQVSGANGAGKTTLLRLLATSLTPSSGRILWRGDDLGRRRAEYRFDMIYLGHQTGVKGALTARENLSWLLPLHPNAERTIDRALAMAGLGGLEDVACHTLSAGQQRRVALARLHLSAATLWILDEPFTAIDRSGVAGLEALIQGHARRGGVVVVTTHQRLGLDGVRLLELEPYGHG